MKNILNFSIISILSIVVLLLAILSTTGVETKKFNKLITKKVKTKNQDIYLILNTIKFKLDIKEINSAKKLPGQQTLLQIKLLDTALVHNLLICSYLNTI